MNSSACLEHLDQKNKFFCSQPCKIPLCESCLKNHNEHDIKSMEKIVEEIVSVLEKAKRHENAKRILSLNQTEVLKHFRSELIALMKAHEEKKQQMMKKLTKPLDEIIKEFNDRANYFITSLNEREELCEAIQSKTIKKITELTSKIDSIKVLAEEYNNEVYQQWSTNSYKVVTNNSDDHILDIDSLKSHFDALIHINVSEKMAILVQCFTDALQKEVSDPISNLLSNTYAKIEETKGLQSKILKAHKTLKDIIPPTELMKNEMKSSLIEIRKMIEQKVKGASDHLDKTEESLKKVREKLISKVKSANTFYAELIKQRKQIEESEMMQAKAMAEWKRGIKLCERENLNFKKQLARLHSLMDDYGNEIVKNNQQYNIRSKEFDELDNKLQALRTKMIKKETKIDNEKTYKLRLSAISLCDNQALVLVNAFFNDSSAIDLNERIKSFHVTLKFESCSGDFSVWYLGEMESAKSVEVKYYQNVEYILLVYDLDDKEEKALEKLKLCLDFFKDKTKATFLLTGVHRGKAPETVDQRMIASYVKAVRIPLKVVNIEQNDEVKTLFYEIFYAQYPELYEQLN